MEERIKAVIAAPVIWWILAGLSLILALLTFVSFFFLHLHTLVWIFFGLSCLLLLLTLADTFMYVGIVISEKSKLKGEKNE